MALYALRTSENIKKKKKNITQRLIARVETFITFLWYCVQNTFTYCSEAKKGGGGLKRTRCAENMKYFNSKSLRRRDWYCIVISVICVGHLEIVSLRGVVINHCALYRASRQTRTIVIIIMLFFCLRIPTIGGVSRFPTRSDVYANVPLVHENATIAFVVPVRTPLRLRNV